MRAGSDTMMDYTEGGCWYWRGWYRYLPRKYAHIVAGSQSLSRKPTEVVPYTDRGVCFVTLLTTIVNQLTPVR